MTEFELGSEAVRRPSAPLTPALVMDGRILLGNILPTWSYLDRSKKGFGNRSQALKSSKALHLCSATLYVWARSTLSDIFRATEYEKTKFKLQASMDICRIGGGVRGKHIQEFLSQLPKIAPAPIGRLIVRIYPDAVDPLRHLATDSSTITAVKTLISDTLRKPAKLVGDPGQVSPLSPQVGAQTDVAIPARMLNGKQPAHFEDVWSTSLNLGGPSLDPTTSLYGFTSALPFYCAWADGIKTSYPAAHHGPHESRYSSRVVTAQTSSTSASILTSTTPCSTGPISL
ncbi:MAG: hypothetical protein M1827_001005 [Pycnora praestabilis]|nr:MAG: hypothetical protein M1827_001005 [Pycnora praestabilis]